jgi:hypothetical protein
MPIRFSWTDVTDNAADKTGPYTPELSAVALVACVFVFSMLSENEWLITDRTTTTDEVIAEVIGAMLDEV